MDNKWLQKIATIVTNIDCLYEKCNDISYHTTNVNNTVTDLIKRDLNSHIDKIYKNDHIHSQDVSTLFEHIISFF